MHPLLVFALALVGIAVIVGWVTVMFSLMDDENYLAAAVILTFGLAVMVTGFNYVITREDAGTFRTKGGQGPATVCWYEVEDNVTMAGKVPVQSEDTYTVCAVKAGDVPPEVAPR